METKHLKSYAPKARRQFIDSISKRAAQLGITESGISDIQISGSSAIIEGRAYTKKQGEQRNRLAKFVEEKGYSVFIRETAYTWFNRMVAIRYMEIHDYLEHGYRVLSHPKKVGDKPEILEYASDVASKLGLDKDHVVNLQLDGNKDEELYRLLLVGQCNYLHGIMPFMFEAVDGPSELLLPDNLTKTDSILHDLITDVPENDWQEIESIGWLYQFYISEHKDSVIGKVVRSEDIPAATQLFTPKWIVKYLVENSLGRQWLSTYPKSPLKDKMDYYIEPAEQSEDTVDQLKLCTPNDINPEDIKVLDPACGSGHILVEAYDVLKNIYLERLYRSRDIPSLIINKNIFGLDIDIRAAQLSSFALLMKARADDPLIFDKIQNGKVVLNVHSIESTEHLDLNELWSQLNLFNEQKKGASLGLFFDIEKEGEMSGESKEMYETFQYILTSFEQAKTLGSLIEIDNNKMTSILKLKDMILSKISGSDFISRTAGQRLLPIMQQSIALAYKYDVVIANPPYMGGKGMNPRLKNYVKNNYPNSKTDLFSVYIEKCLDFGKKNAQLGLVTPYVWMFIGSYELVRKRLINKHCITSLVQLEYNAFAPACIPVCTFTVSKQNVDSYLGSYIKLTDFKGPESQPIKTLEAIKNPHCGWFYKAVQSNFKKLPGSPIGYWLKDKYFDIFNKSSEVGDFANAKQGLATADNDRFLRRWHEVELSKSNLIDSQNKIKWIKHNKGGSFRRWYGNNEWVVNWENNGEEIRIFGTENGGRARSRVQNSNFYFKEGLTWSDLTSSLFASRYVEDGYIFDITGPSLFSKKSQIDNYFFLGYTNSSVFQEFLNVSLQGMHYSNGVIAGMPCVVPDDWESSQVERLVNIYKQDWVSNETSFLFKKSKLNIEATPKLETSLQSYIQKQRSLVEEAQELEEANNLYFAEKYGLVGDVKTRPSEDKITLHSNLRYRYSTNDTKQIQNRYVSDLISEEISFSIGCMMGRYSLDREGLVYAHVANNGFDKLIAENAYESFAADEDGIIPLTDQEWFKDDATNRFREFVQIVWGEEHLQENLGFIAESLSLNAIKPKKTESALETIRRYMSTQFYKDHLKTYKKRPIYWLFSSGKQKAFECLIYLHRYNEGTLSRMRTEYVIPLMGMYDNEIALLTNEKLHANGNDLRGIEKNIVSLQKKQLELRSFDEQLKHYADMRISLDLDDGVKANYGKFGTLLADVKSIHGKG